MNSLIYVGMDVHKESISIAVLRDSSKNTEFERTIRNDTAEIKRFFKRLKDKGENIIQLAPVLLLFSLRAVRILWNLEKKDLPKGKSLFCTLPELYHSPGDFRRKA